MLIIARFLFYPTLVFAYMDKRRDEPVRDEGIAGEEGEAAGERTPLL
jgi:hypothetical protein